MKKGYQQYIPSLKEQILNKKDMLESNYTGRHEIGKESNNHGIATFSICPVLVQIGQSNLLFQIGAFSFRLLFVIARNSEIQCDHCIPSS